MSGENASSAPARRVAVTGGAGFIGSHVADTFLARGYEVLVLDDLSAGSEQNVPAAASFVRLDIRDRPALADALGAFAPSAVCHLAAQASVTVSVKDPAHDMAVNVGGTFNVLDVAKDCAAPVVFASTGGALYGEDAKLPSPETTWAEPLSPYGASKLAGEAYVRTWAALHGAPNVVLRLGNVYGPRQSPHGEAGVVAIFSERLYRGETPTVFGDGTQTRDYIYVGDVASAFALCAESGRRGTYNVGTGRESSVIDLLAVLQDLAPAAMEPEFKPLRPGELTRSALDSTRLREALGWEPRVALDEGLKLTYESYAGTNSNGSESAMSARRGA
jgi:UDP-glucose 4-epimerase